MFFVKNKVESRKSQNIFVKLTIIIVKKNTELGPPRQTGATETSGGLGTITAHHPSLALIPPTAYRQDFWEQSERV